MSKMIFDQVGMILVEKGLQEGKSTIVDSLIINGSASTKNIIRQRDAEMRSSRKSSKYHFSMKTHIGEDSITKVIHLEETTGASVHGSKWLVGLLHGEGKRHYASSAYNGRRRRFTPPR